MRIAKLLLGEFRIGGVCAVCAVFYRSSYGREEDLFYDSDTHPESAFAGAFGGGSSAPSVRIRKDFTETWIWEMAEAG